MLIILTSDQTKVESHKLKDIFDFIEQCYKNNVPHLYPIDSKEFNITQMTDWIHFHSK